MFSPAFWSAVAALCSATAAFLTLLINRRNLLDAARPELVLSGWTRTVSPDGTWSDRIHVGTIKNAGRGVALGVGIRLIPNPLEPDAAAISGVRYRPIIGSGDTENLDVQITALWKNVRTEHVKGNASIVPTLEITCWDYRRYRHATRYPMLVSEKAGHGDESHHVAPGVFLLPRTTVSSPVWWLKVTQKLSRVPVVRRWFRADDPWNIDLYREP